MPRNPQVYSPQGLTTVALPPVVSTRNPTQHDTIFSIGQLWVNTATQNTYVLAEFTIIGAVWVTATAVSGDIVATSVTISPGDLTLSGGGEFDITGDINQTGDNGIIGNLDVSGTTTVADLTVTGVFSIDSGTAIVIESDSNTAPALSLLTNGGTTETILIENKKGTSAASIQIKSDAGGITVQTPTKHIILSADVSSLDLGDDALVVACDGGAGKDISFTSTAGSFTVDAGESVADAIVINASGAAGAVQIKAGSAGVLIGDEADTAILDLGNIAPTSSRTITVGGGTVITAAVTDTINVSTGGATTNANSIKTLNLNTGSVTLGQVLTNIASGTVTSGTHTTNIASGNRAAGTMSANLMTGTGTKTLNIGNADHLTTINMIGTQNINASANANVNINTGNSIGAVSIGNSLAGAITVASGAAVGIDGVAASHFTVTGAAADLLLSSVGGSVNVTGTEAINDAIVLFASDAVGGVQIKAGSGGVLIGNQATASPLDFGNIAPTATRNINIGSGTVVTAAVTDTVNLGIGGATTNANSIKTVNVGSGNVTTGQNIVNINSGTAASGTQTTNIASGTGGGTKVVNVGNADALTTINLLGTVNNNVGASTGNVHINDGTGTGTVSVGNSLSGIVSLLSGSAVNINVSNNFPTNINTDTSNGAVNIGSANAGVITIGSSSHVDINPSINHTTNINTGNSSGAVNIGNSLAGAIAVQSSSTLATTSADTTIITSSKASATAIQITSSNGVGGVLVNTGGGVIALSSAGNVSMVSATASAASPTATVEIDARVGTATFTGYTTASAGVQKFTITNSVSTTSKACFATATHTGAGDAQLTVGAQCLNGSMVFTVTNVGLASVNGPILLSFWIIN